MTEPLQIGQKVLISEGITKGHCRTPYYLRGQKGVVVENLGLYLDPEKLAYGKPGLPMRQLYKIKFGQTQLWPAYSGPASDSLVADIFEYWIEPLPE